MRAARALQPSVTAEDLEYAVARVVAGMEKPSKVVTEADRAIVATHETGRAVVAWMLPGPERVLTISIVPRANRLVMSSSFRVNPSYYLHEFSHATHANSLAFRQSYPSDLKLRTQVHPSPSSA